MPNLTNDIANLSTYNTETNIAYNLSEPIILSWSRFVNLNIFSVVNRGFHKFKNTVAKFGGVLVILGIDNL